MAEILRVLLRRGTHTQPAFTEGALRLLREYRWPGNVRELSNVAERLSLLYDGGSFDEAVVLEALYPGSEGPEQGTAGETARRPRYPLLPRDRPRNSPRGAAKASWKPR